MFIKVLNTPETINLKVFVMPKRTENVVASIDFRLNRLLNKLRWEITNEKMIQGKNPETTKSEIVQEIILIGLQIIRPDYFDTEMQKFADDLFKNSNINNPLSKKIPQSNASQAEQQVSEGATVVTTETEQVAPERNIPNCKCPYCVKHFYNAEVAKIIEFTGENYYSAYCSEECEKADSLNGEETTGD